MAFPVSGVLDAFTRANTGPPPGPGWSGSFYSDPGGLIVVSNACKGNNAGFNSAYWTSSFSASSSTIEMYFDVSTAPVNGQTIWLELIQQNAGSFAAPNGYGLDYTRGATDGTWRFYKFTAGAQAGLGAGNTTITGGVVAGDGVGVSLSPSGVLTFYRRSSGVWSAQGSTVTDTTYTGSFNLGVELNATGTVIDNFGGGTAGVFVTAPPAAATASFPAPTPKVTVPAPAASATASISPPTVTATSASGTVIVPPPATANASFPSPRLPVPSAPAQWIEADSIQDGTVVSDVSFSVGVVSLTVAAANVQRLKLVFTNSSDSPIYLSLGGVAVAGAGVRVAPASVFKIGTYVGSVEAVQAGGGVKTLGVQEEV